MNTVVRILLGVAFAVTIALAGALVAGELSVPLAWFSLTIGALFPVVGIYRDQRSGGLQRPVGIGWMDLVMGVIFGLFALRSFLWVVSFAGNDLRVLNVNNVGDLPLHWQYTRFLAQGAAFWPDNPLTAHGSIGYPFGVDFLNSLLWLTGLDLVRGVVWVGLIACILTAAALFRWGGAFVIAGFLFNGGLAGFEVFRGGELGAAQTVDWKSIPLSLFVTQRGFLYAFPVGLLLLDSWRTRLRGAGGNPSLRKPLPLWVEVVFYATLPLFHLHSFLFLSVLLAWWFVFGPSGLRRHWLTVVGIAWVPASALVLFLTDGFGGHGSPIGFHPGWMQGDRPWHSYWLINFGIWPLLLLWLCLTLAWRGIRRPSEVPGEDAIARHFAFPAVAILLACCFFRFAYWEWDNTKLMAWGYLTVLPFLWDTVLRPLKLPIRIPLIALLFFSGALALWSGLTPKGNGYTLIQRSEIDVLERVFESIPIEARFACSPDYQHPLVFLGRKMTMAYAGHFVGHGLPLEAVQKDQTTLMNGYFGWRDAAQRLQADYVFWGPRERAAFPGSAQSWKLDSVLIAKGEWGELYQLMPKARAERTATETVAPEK